MPELPEVETTRLGISGSLERQTVKDVIIRQQRLRWQVPSEIKQLAGEKLQKIERRGKYLLFFFKTGTLFIHLGMSGSLRLLKNFIPPEKHDHIDLIFKNGICLRFNDPRRFGAWIWTSQNPLEHSLLKKLGPEPLTAGFSAKYLFDISRNRNVSIKTFVMNSHVIVGVGNIYANEALFLAGIKPTRKASSISPDEAKKLVSAIKQTLRAAIKKGGTTLRNFSDSEGKPGYFKQQLKVYGRGGLPCLTCKSKIQELRLGQRSTYYCPECQI